jgi:hypothetical protein
MKNKNVSKIAIAFFALAGLLFAYAVWGFIYCRSNIISAVASGQLTAGGNEYSIVNFYMANSLIYVIHAALVFGIGWLIMRSHASAKAERAEEPGPDGQDGESQNTMFKQYNRNR